MSRVVLSLFGSIATLAVFGAPAAALPPVPPDNSEVDQYVPTIPDSEGDNPLGGGGKDRGAPLPPSTVEDLRAAGADGEGAVILSEQTAPRSPATGGRPGHAGNDDRSSSTRDRSDGSGDESVAGAVLEGLASGSGGGVGILLPIFLGVVAGVGAFLALRRRSPAQG